MENVNLKILELRGLPVHLLIDIVHKNGGILGPAHPCGEKYLSIRTSACNFGSFAIRSKRCSLSGFEKADSAASVFIYSSSNGTQNFCRRRMSIVLFLHVL